MSRKFQEQLKEANFDAVKYYYELGGVTVCLLVKGGVVEARGMSICSHKDQFVKRVGRVKALGKAMKAYLYQGSFERVPDDVKALIPLLRSAGLSVYKPKLSIKEFAILYSCLQSKSQSTGLGVA